MANEEAGAGKVLDRRTGEMGTRLEKPPLPGKIGKDVYENVSQESWDEWCALEIRIINEYRINLADPEQRKVVYQQMREFFNIPQPE